jgi:hypothetical protein
MCRRNAPLHCHCQNSWGFALIINNILWLIASIHIPVFRPTLYFLLLCRSKQNKLDMTITTFFFAYGEIVRKWHWVLLFNTVTSSFVPWQAKRFSHPRETVLGWLGHVQFDKNGHWLYWWPSLIGTSIIGGGSHVDEVVSCRAVSCGALTKIWLAGNWHVVLAGIFAISRKQPAARVETASR